MPPGWTLHYTRRTGSTNDDARAAARRGCPDRSVFVTDVQSAGRGRLARAWLAADGTSLLLSVVLRTGVRPILATATCSVVLVELLRTEYGLAAAAVKWPNDVMVGGRKAGGILTETVGTGAIVVGIGLNVNWCPEESEDGPRLRAPTTCLAAELGKLVSREALLHQFLMQLDAWLICPEEELARRMLPRWEKYLWRRLQDVQVEADGEVIRGIVEGLDPTGALRLRLTTGEARLVVVGDVLVPAESAAGHLT